MHDQCMENSYKRFAIICHLTTARILYLNTIWEQFAAQLQLEISDEHITYH